ncbi:lipocalin family protein [Tenacibaculum ovolyticum]|uniref:lipocalin family protein n=1 Tax=Tenacibaculum ovolyticum TaxID=104270 RepID=UPI003BA9A180
MKRLLILSITILTLISCSSNDDNLDPFIGTWSFSAVDGTEADECSQKTTLTILENGNFINDHYELIDDKCELENTNKGTWINRSGGNYGITQDGSTKESVNKVTFTNNNNTFSFNETDDDGTVEIITYKRK